MKEQDNVYVERHYKGDMSPSEVKKLGEKYPVLKKHFDSYQYLDVFKRDGEVVALRIDGCIIYTHEGEFYRIYANTLFKIRIQGGDSNYLYVVVPDEFNRIGVLKKLDISLPIKDESKGKQQ
jgi:hypothetical protein